MRTVSNKGKGEIAVTFAGDRSLRLPGPSPVPDRIVRAMSHPMMGHRSARFQDLLEGLVGGLRELFETEHNVYVLAGSGTLAMESAVANLLAPGDTCVVASAGKFGERWIELCEAFAASAVKVEAPYGEPISPEAIADALDREPEARVVFMTQNESSTGVQHDVEAVARVVRARDRLLVVDAVSSLGGAPLSMDEWGVDVVVSGSQKCLMLPPGLAFVAVGTRAKAHSEERSKGTRYYADWRRYHESLNDAQTPYTPALSLLFGLEESLAILAEEGKGVRFARHRLMREMVRAGLEAMGCTPLVGPTHASLTVTSMRHDGLDVDALRKAVQMETGVVLSGGQGSLKGSIFRVGHMGAATPMDMIATLAAVEIGMVRLGHSPDIAVGQQAAMEVWRTWND